MALWVLRRPRTQLLRVRWPHESAGTSRMTVAGSMTGNQAGSSPPQLTAPENLRPDFSDPVFLMTNDPETGGMERQFVEIARGLSAPRVPVRPGVRVTPWRIRRGQIPLSVLLAEDQLWNPEINERWVSPSRLRNQEFQGSRAVEHACGTFVDAGAAQAIAVDSMGCDAIVHFGADEEELSVKCSSLESTRKNN